jgi:hypothetical protein
MSVPPDAEPHRIESSFDSSDSPIIISDGPGDTTVRPARDVLRRFNEAQREKLRRWEEWKKQQGDADTSGASEAP